jgi:hypothetical protein
MLTVSAKGHRVHTNFTLTTSPAALTTGSANRKSVIFQNQGAAIAYIGPFGVSSSGAARGYALAGGASFTDDASGEEWWGVTDSGTTSLHVIEVR